MSDSRSDNLKPFDTGLLISGYLENRLNQGQFEELKAWIHADRENARLFMRQCFLIQQIREELRWNDVLELPVDEVHSHDTKGETLRSLQDLLEYEENQPIVMVNIDDRVAPICGNDASGSTSENKRTKRELLVLAGYVARHAIRQKATAIGAIAAILLLGMTLVIAIQLGVGETSPVAEKADPVDPSESIAEAPAIALTVGYLTAERDAMWQTESGRFAPSVGDQLTAGQWLSLTQGLAELTTSDGTVVILEAPITVELINDTNAIRLETGRLVGRCLTPSSKGFTVLTETHRIVDLGTEFGVRVRANGSTQVDVFDGEVSTQQLADSAVTESQPPKLLRGGQAARLVGSEHLPVQLDEALYTRKAFQSRDRLVGSHKPSVVWSFDAIGADRTIFDNGELGMNLKLGDGARLARSPYGSALVFQDMIEPPAYVGDLSPNFSAPFTIEAWLRTDQIGNESMRILANDSGDGGVGLAIAGDAYVAPGPQLVDLQGETFTAGSYSVKFTLFREYDLITEGEIVPGKFSHVVVVVDQQNVPVIYINGRKQRVGVEDRVKGRPGQNVSPLPTSSDTFRLGRLNQLTQDSKEPFIGELDELAIYSKALTESDVVSLYSAVGTNTTNSRTNEAKPRGFE